MPPDLYLSQNNPADKITHSYCFTIKYDKILPSTVRYTKWYLPCRLYEQQTACMLLISPIRVAFLAHLNRLYLLP